jgi:hypothetical protein
MSTTKRRLEKEEKERTKQKMHKATGRVAKIVVKGPPPNPKPNCILVILNAFSQLSSSHTPSHCSKFKLHRLHSLDCLHPLSHFTNSSQLG